MMQTSYDSRIRGSMKAYRISESRYPIMVAIDTRITDAIITG
jgi:hypothetical protein